MGRCTKNDFSKWCEVMNGAEGFQGLCPLCFFYGTSFKTIYLIAGQKKLGKVITPDPWKTGARNTTGMY